jgi:tetratricopeptide (TPR) repeat protein
MLQKSAAKRPSSRQVADTLMRLQSRTLSPGWLVGTLSTLLVALGLGYHFLGRGILADLGRERPPRMVVLPIRNQTGDPTLDSQVAVGMTELLSTALQGSPGLSVVEPESVARAIANLRMSPAECAEPAGQARIARALGAPLLLRGTLDRGAQAQVFSYALVDASGRTRHSGTTRAALQASFAPFALVDPAAHDLLQKVDPLRAKAHRNLPVPPEAFASYANGKALFLKGDFKGSEGFLREAAMKAPGFSSAVSAYAACLRRLGRDQALPVANWALMSAKATGDRWAEGRALGLKAYLAKDQGDLDEAQRLREAALALALASGDREGETLTYNHLGLIARDRGRDAEARRFYEKSLRLSQQTGDQTYLSLAQNNLANLALKRGDLKEAESLYWTNLNLQEGLGNRFGEALALNNLGVVALMARDLAGAESLLTKALAIREAVGDKEGQISCLRNLGILALIKEQAALAEDHHGRAMALAQQMGRGTMEAECQFYLAELARSQQRFAQAREAYLRVLQLLPEGVTPEVRANALAGLTECLARQRRPEWRDGERRLSLLRPAEADSPYVHRAKAWLAFLAGQWALAQAELSQALSDPRRQAPEIRAELEATRALFEAKGR